MRPLSGFDLHDGTEFVLFLIAMKPIGVFYATREGHTRRIAGHVAGRLRELGFEPDVRNVRNEADRVSLANYDGAMLLASLHIGTHEREMIAFARRHRAELEAMPSAMISVSLAEAGVERSGATPERRAKSAGEVQQTIDRFRSQTGWRPELTKPVAGALLYTKYNFFLRFVMKQIARMNGGDTDTSHDYEYTNWQALDRFVEQFAAELEPKRSTTPA